MSKTEQFKKERNQIFSLLLNQTWKDKKIWEHIRDGELIATPAFEGKLYQKANTKVMFVGRDLNGWDKPLVDCSDLNQTVMSITNQTDSFDDFVDKRGFGDGKRKYFHKHSNFFRFMKHILEFLGESDADIEQAWYTDSKQWNQKFIWANLYCISPRKPKNASEAHPDNKMIKLGIDHYVDLMKLYVTHYCPNVVIFITDVDGWFIRWKKQASFKDFVENYEEHTNNNIIVATGNVGTTKIIVCKRPDRRGTSYENVKEMARNISEQINNSALLKF